MPTGNVDKAADELHHTVGVTIARRHEKHSTPNPEKPKILARAVRVKA
jgi:hypothetical protein